MYNIFYILISNRNILLSKDSVIKLADMGLSRMTNDTGSVYSMAGSREYISPEILECVLDSEKSYSFKTDIWFALFFIFYQSTFESLICLVQYFLLFKITIILNNLKLRIR